jgi:hypothetical protein
MLPLELILTIGKIGNDALDRAEADMAASLEILKTIGGGE